MDGNNFGSNDQNNTGNGSYQNTGGANNQYGYQNNQTTDGQYGSSQNNQGANGQYGGYQNNQGANDQYGGYQNNQGANSQYGNYQNNMGQMPPYPAPIVNNSIGNKANGLQVAGLVCGILALRLLLLWRSEHCAGHSRPDLRHNGKQPRQARRRRSRAGVFRYRAGAGSRLTFVLYLGIPVSG